MAAFEYTALGSDGKKSTGVITADTARAARKELRLRQLTPLKLSETSEDAASGSGLRRRRRGLGSADRVLMTRQLAMLISSGLPVEQALAAVASQGDKPAIRRLVSTIRTSVTEGYKFSEALGQAPRAFPPLYRAVIAAGEASGTLGPVMERLAHYLENAQKTRRKVQTALIYPIVLSVVAILVIILLMAFVVPRVVVQFESLDAELPALTSAVIALSGFIRSWGWGVLIGAGLLIWAMRRLLRVPRIKHRADRLVLGLPVIGGLARTVNGARFARTFSTLVASGAPMVDSLMAARGALGNLVFVDAVDQIITSVSEGGTLSGAMRKTAVFPPMLVHMAASGEGSGGVDVMMEKGADYLEDEFDSASAVALGLLEPLIIVLLGTIVALIVLAIMLPILRLNSLALG